MPLAFILGGARSGKSAAAQAWAEARSASPVMIATAQAFDDEMAARIATHRAERGAGWRTVEAPLELAAAVRALGAGEVAVVDCLTLWLSNLILADRDPTAAAVELVDAVRTSPAAVVVVSNEVGLGIVPDNTLARRFRDEAGRLHQAVAAEADEVTVMFAGMALRMKG